jgi:two-component system chemotaxis sensor kinase CheA
MSDDMSAYRDVFLSESAEYLQAVTDGLLALEQDASASDAIDTVFRGAHSLKGMAGAMGYSATADLTHGIESMMDAVRQRHRHADSALVDLALRAIDAVRELIEVESVGGTETPDISALLVELEFAAQPSFEPEQESDEPLLAATSDGTPVLVVTVTLEEECVLKSVRAYMAIKRLIQVGTILDTEPSVRDIEDDRLADD